MPRISSLTPPRQAKTVVLYLVDTSCFAPISRLGELDFLNEKQQSRAVAMSEKRRTEYQLSRWLLRRALAHAIPDSRQSDIQIFDQKDLPPRSPQAERAELHFGISHSAGKVGVAVTAAGPVGLDLEYIGKKRDYLNSAQQFCNAQELAALKRAEPISAMPQLFYQLWTQKEAWLKSRCLGIGAVPMGKVCFTPVDSNPALPADADCIASSFCHDRFQYAIVCQQHISVELIELVCAERVSENTPVQPQVSLFALQDSLS